MTDHSSLPDTALLFCNGEPPERRTARLLARSTGLLAAADGGANLAHALGLTPDLIIGDLDSVNPSLLRKCRSTVIKRIRRQDTTDLEKALDYLGGLGMTRVFVVGATGRRIDMTLANLTVLWNYVRRMEIIVVGTGWYAVPVRGECRMRAPRGTTVSLIPYGACRNVTLRGLRYPLTNATIAAVEAAVSNVVTRGKFSVRIGKGRALLVVLTTISDISSLISDI